ncbi:MAG: hypothetical protein KBI47_12230 [Armatimonadetes bacterium]|nr:hypothetical protein [Armatimonadota bacterium]
MARSSAAMMAAAELCLMMFPVTIHVSQPRPSTKALRCWVVGGYQLETWFLLKIVLWAS